MQKKKKGGKRRKRRRKEEREEKGEEGERSLGSKPYGSNWSISLSLFLSVFPLYACQDLRRGKERKRKEKKRKRKEIKEKRELKERSKSTMMMKEKRLF